MVRVKQPTSMRRLAVVAVAAHIELIAYGPAAQNCLSLRQINETETYLTLQGPFTLWPSEMLQELLEVVAEKRSLARTILHLLIQPHLEAFNFACGAGDAYYAIRFLVERCQKLQQLDLSYISFLGPDVLCRLVQHLPNVKSLNLQMTPVTDQLRHLDVSSAPVTDHGLVALCHLAEDGSSPTGKLQRLSVLDTQITPQGVAYVMRNSPQLRQIDYESLIQVFDHLSELRELGRKEEALQDLNVHYKLTTIKSTNELQLTDDLASVVYLCPNLQSVSLVMGAIVDVDALFSLTQLAHLNELSLTNGPALSLDFFTSVVPILQCVGQRLDSLTLVRFDCVDLFAIGSNCLRLRNLALSEMCHITVADNGDNIFGRLEALELWALDGVPLPGVVIKQLMKSCHHIKNVLFRGCDAVTDDLFGQLWRVNPMKSVSQLTFDGCRHVSATTIISILGRDDDLHVLRLWNCPLLDQDDYALLLATVSSGNMDVAIDWYPYTEWT